MMIPLVSLVASSAVTGAALVLCSSSNRQPASRKPSSKKSSKSAKSSKSQVSKRGSSKSRKSSKSKKSSSKSRRGSKKSKKDASSKSGKSGKSGKSSKKSNKKGKPSDASSKKTKSAKSGQKTASGSNSTEKALHAVPNDSRYSFPEGNVKASTLRASPNKLPFPPSGGAQSIVISNTTKSRKAFKVKTSDNMLYRVNPVYGFVEPGADISIDVLRHNGEKKTDNLVVLTSNATEGQENAKAIFESYPARELTVVPLVAH